MDAERRVLRQCGELALRRCVGFVAVDNHSDLVPARREFARQVGNMPKQATDRRAHHLQDLERRLSWHGGFAIDVPTDNRIAKLRTLEHGSAQTGLIRYLPAWHDNGGLDVDGRRPWRQQELALNAFWRIVLPVFGLMGARLAGAAFGFLSQILLARSFSAHDVGIAFLAMSVTTFVSLLITCGYHTIALTYLARYQALGRQRLVEGFLAVSRRDIIAVALLVLASAPLFYVLAPVSSEIAEATLYGCLAALPLAVIRLNNSAANAQRRFTLSYAPDFVARPGLLLVFIAALVFFHIERRIDYVLIALVVLTFGVAVGQAIILGPDNAFSRAMAKPTRDMTRFFRGRAAAMLLVTVVAGATADLVVMLGGALFLPSEVAVLGVAVRLAALVGFFSSASQQFVLRDLATAMTRQTRAEVDDLLMRTNVAGLATMLASIVVVAIFGRFILSIYGEAYAAAYWPLLLFMISQAFRVVGGMNGHLLALGGHQVRSATLCACAVALLIVLSVLLAPAWGVTGIAVAAVVAEAFWAIGLAYLTQRFEGRRGDIIGLLTVH
jgi:O-antigen/teichoic acid export membrane protein